MRATTLNSVSDIENVFRGLPLEQRSIWAKCFHPSGTFAEFTKRDVEQSATGRFEQIASRYPDRAAIKSRGGVLSYDALNKSANRLAHAIISKGGAEVCPVALLLGHDATMITGILGTWKAGKACVPLDPRFHEAKIEHLLRDADAGLLVTDGESLASVGRAAPDPARVIDVDDTGNVSFDENPGLPIAPERPCYLLYTSGSTGQPKGVLQNHRALLHDVRAYTDSFHICADDRLTLFASMSGGEGMKSVFAALLNGATVYPWDIRRDGLTGLAGWLIDEQITIWISTPSVFRNFMTALTGKENFAALRLVRLGSGVVRKGDVELYKRHFSAECILINWLACTEIGSYARYFIDKATEIHGEQVPVGFELPDKNLVLLDDRGEVAGPGQIGEIAVSGPYLPAGYWHRGDLTQSRFRRDPKRVNVWTYFTGDLGRKRPDGCLEFLGRIDSQVKIRGYRIELNEIENVLGQHPGVREAVVVARADTEGENRLVGYIVANGEIDTGMLHHSLKDRLADYMVPSTFVFLDSLPLASSGKVDRTALPFPGPSRPKLDVAFVAPRTANESLLAKLWAELLNCEQIGIDDNFFELGGHSLLATQVVSRVRVAFGVELPLRSMFECPTVAGLTRRIEALSRAGESDRVGFEATAQAREKVEL
jgi:amino acid adenylation domain-containing protein